MSNLLYLIMLYSMATLSICCINADPQQEEWIIFVHGTLGLRHNFEWKTFLTLFKEDINNTPYQKTIDILRDDPFLYQNQAIQERGLHEIDIKKQHTHGANLFTDLFDKLYQTKQTHPKTVRYFTFGWSGLVSAKIRYQEASKLYEQLRKQLLAAQQEGKIIHISFYCYSHGGNVGLNLAAVRTMLYPRDTFIIDTLVLIGTPIQRETDYLVCHPIFQSIYHIYSRADRIQTLDCFSFKRFFSRRRFKRCRRFELPSNLRQIEVRLRDYCKGKWLDRSPGHIELWFFGWPEHKKSLYRPHFPFYPLPMAIFVPNIIELVNQHSKENHVVLELRPAEHRASMRTRHRYDRIWIDFLSQQQINQLCMYADHQKPGQLDSESYNCHMQAAASLAQALTSELRHTNKETLCGS